MKIVRVAPAENFFSITWMIGSRCNYDCMYCSKDWHDDDSAPHDLATLQRAWQNIYNKSRECRLPYKISITGGEPTANKSFAPFIEWLRSHYSEVQMIALTTNGSASFGYYKKLCSMIESISFSTHSEHINEQDFFDKVERLDRLMIRPKKSLHVNIMNEFWHQDRIKLYEKWLNDRGISNSINEVDLKYRTRDIPILKGKFDFEI